MKNFLIQNLPTILLGLALLGAVIFIICKMIRNKKQGKSSCGCGCGSCPNASNCHPAPEAAPVQK